MVQFVLSRIYTAADDAVRPMQTETALAADVFGADLRRLNECGLLFSGSTLCGGNPEQ